MNEEFVQHALSNGAAGALWLQNILNIFYPFGSIVPSSKNKLGNLTHDFSSLSSYTPIRIHEQKPIPLKRMTKTERTVRYDVIYFRVAIRMKDPSQWRWKSSMLNTPGTLFNFLTMYDCVPKDRLRIFFATSMNIMNEMLVRENRGLLSNSITVEDFLKSGRKIDGQRIKELEFELGLQASGELVARSAITRKLGDERVPMPATHSFEIANHSTLESIGSSLANILASLKQEDSEWNIGGDHDTPYTFSLPVSMPQALAWARLLAKVQNGELIP